MYAISEKNIADVQNIRLHWRWEHLKQSAQYVQSKPPDFSPWGTWAFGRIHRAETKTGITGLRRDLLGYLRQCPITQKDISLYKNISRDPQVHVTVLAITASWQNIWPS